MEDRSGVGAMLRFSWKKSQEILFPFNFKRWFKILIIVWLAAVGVQGCTANFTLPRKPQAVKIPKIQAPSKIPQPVIEKGFPQVPFSGEGDAQTGQTGPEMKPGTVPAVTKVSGTSQDLMSKRRLKPNSLLGAARLKTLQGKMVAPPPKINPLWIVLPVAGLLTFGLALFIFFLWISARFNFILLHAVTTRDASIVEPFRRYRESGNSFFKWNLFLLGATLGILIIFGFLSVLIFLLFKWLVPLGVGLGIFIVLLFLLVMLALFVISVLVHDFVLPLMFQEKIPVWTGIKKFFKRDGFAAGKIVKYLVVVFLLWIAASVIQWIVMILTALGGIIAGGILAVPGIVLVKTVPFLTVPFLILVTPFVIALIFAVLIVAGMVMLPITLFFRTFALAYLTRLYPECDLLSFSQGK